MGAWNATPFGNDTALDWLSGLTGLADGRALLASTLGRIKSGKSADAPEAEEALAAAALVAAAATDPVGTIVADARQWIVTNGFVPGPKLLDGALQAIAAIRSKSELRDLWDEAGSLKTWTRQLDKLSEQLQRARDSGVPARSPKTTAMPRSLHKLLDLHAKQPDPKLREKILAKVAALKDPNGKNPDTDFGLPLTLVARHGLLPETLHLLARGADPNLDTSRPFIEACTAGHLEVARALHSAGATIFHEHRPHPDLPAVGVQVAIKDSGEPVQGHRYCLALFSVARKGPPGAADYLLELGAKLDQTDLNGETLLHKAAEAGWKPMLDYLVDKGLDPNCVKGESGESPLHYAARAGKLEAVRALLEHGANPNIVDRFEGESQRWSETPLDVAESPEVRKLLIARGGLASVRKR